MTCVFHIVCVCVFVIFGARPSVVVVVVVFFLVCFLLLNNTCLLLERFMGNLPTSEQVKHPMFSAWDLTSTGKPCQVGSKFM